jgi:hypothetical protein
MLLLHSTLPFVNKVLVPLLEMLAGSVDEEEAAHAEPSSGRASTENCPEVREAQKQTTSLDARTMSGPVFFSTQKI